MKKFYIFCTQKKTSIFISIALHADDLFFNPASGLGESCMADVECVVVNRHSHCDEASGECICNENAIVEEKTCVLQLGNLLLTNT